MTAGLLGEARLVRVSQLFWDLLLRAAALGQLGKEPEANKAVAELLQLRPDFPTRGRYLIGFYAKTDALADAMIDGLQKAGLKI